jgi:hypothetical protein
MAARVEDMTITKVEVEIAEAVAMVETPIHEMEVDIMTEEIEEEAMIEIKEGHPGETVTITQEVEVETGALLLNGIMKETTLPKLLRNRGITAIQQMKKEAPTAIPLKI